MYLRPRLQTTNYPSLPSAKVVNNSNRGPTLFPFSPQCSACSPISPHVTAIATFSACEIPTVKTVADSVWDEHPDADPMDFELGSKRPRDLTENALWDILTRKGTEDRRSPICCKLITATPSIRDAAFEPLLTADSILGETSLLAERMPRMCYLRRVTHLGPARRGTGTTAPSEHPRGILRVWLAVYHYYQGERNPLKALKAHETLVIEREIEKHILSLNGDTEKTIKKAFLPCCVLQLEQAMLMSKKGFAGKREGGRLEYAVAKNRGADCLLDDLVVEMPLPFGMARRRIAFPLPATPKRSSVISTCSPGPQQDIQLTARSFNTSRDSSLLNLKRPPAHTLGHPSRPRQELRSTDYGQFASVSVFYNHFMPLMSNGKQEFTWSFKKRWSHYGQPGAERPPAFSTANSELVVRFTLSRGTFSSLGIVFLEELLPEYVRSPILVSWKHLGLRLALSVACEYSCYLTFLGILAITTIFRLSISDSRPVDIITPHPEIQTIFSAFRSPSLLRLSCTQLRPKVVIPEGPSIPATSYAGGIHAVDDDSEDSFVDPDVRLPVAVFFGGGFKFGGTIKNNGIPVVSRSLELRELIIFVVMNYR
ncbi:hypothetical protein BJ322DRAFT_1024389 [Thelephora terrestris]|uniref:Uncharacterized protein n=1 Tax=Thelephora terrestris TaxID=56493 RepID=A0A9P6H577_9AGAM|nr:hypothetical protein BJ322DRAFT_1024389 [Thelephora terrestris]